MATLLSLLDVGPAGVAEIVDDALESARDGAGYENRLNGRRVGLIFTAPSTRTKASFWSAAQHLGCPTVTFSGPEIQTSTGESWSDTGQVLAEYVDILVVRTNGPQEELRDLASGFPRTINALTDHEHPTQAVADACALLEHFGSLAGLRVAYVGLINNTARSLATLAALSPGMTLTIYSPPGHGLADGEIEQLNRAAGRAAVHQVAGPPEQPDRAHAVYTTRWNSMGAAPAVDDHDTMSAFAVDTEMLRRFGADEPSMFMHDLPAVRGQEVSAEVLDGPYSLAPLQTRHKRSAAIATLLWSWNHS